MFSFLSKYVPRDVGDIYSLPGVREGSVFFGGKAFRALSFPNDTFMRFNTKDFKQCTDGLKFHIPVSEDQMDIALPIIATCMGEHDMGSFKVRQRPWSAGVSFSTGKPVPHKQTGKDFTLYIGKGKDNIQAIQHFVNDLESRLIAAKVKKPKSNQVGDNLKSADKKVKGSNYLFYRYDRVGSDKYLPASLGFMTPRSGDMMENIRVTPNADTGAQRPVFDMSEQQPVSNEQKTTSALWKQVSWRTLRSENQEHCICCEVERMSAQQQNKLISELKNLGLGCEFGTVKHRDGRLGEVISITPDSCYAFTQLYRGENPAGREISLLKQMPWRSLPFGKNEYRVCCDMETMATHKQDALMSELEKMGIQYDRCTVRHRDGRYGEVVSIKPESYKTFKQVYQRESVNEAKRDEQAQAMLQRYKWRALKGPDEIYRFCCDMEGMSAPRQQKLAHDLSKMGLQYYTEKIKHRDGRLSYVISISPESQDDFAELHGLDGIENANRVRLKKNNVNTGVFCLNNTR